MNKIIKGKKPDCLDETLEISWDSFRNDYTKQYKELKEIIFSEQYSCCAYCETYVKNKSHLRNIEHIIDKEYGKKYVFSWNNLVGVCLGNCNRFDPENSIGLVHPDNLHCDKYKDEVKKGNITSLLKVALLEQCFFTPLSAELKDDIFELNCGTGKLDVNNHLDDEQKIKAKNTIDIFNLNNDYLNNHRDEVARMFFCTLNNLRKSNPRIIKRFIIDWIDPNGKFAKKGFITSRKFLAKKACEKYNVVY